MSEQKTFFCTGCSRECLDGDGCISFDGYESGMCPECNATLTPFQRCLLSMLSRASFDGGPVSIGTTIEEMDKMLRRLFRAYHGHDANSVCRECDPDAHKIRLEMRENARKKQAKPTNQ